MAIPTPNANDMANQSTLRRFVVGNQGSVMVGPKTTLSMTGGRQNNVTAQSLSDIMQGTMSVRGPEELNIVVNKALSNDLDLLYESDYTGVSAFSTAKYEFGNSDASIFGAGSDSNDTSTDTEADGSGGGTPITGVSITVYSPQTGGDRVEGGLESSRAGLDGKSLVRTLDDVNAKTSTYVTLAGDPSLYKKQYNIPTITYDSYKSGSKTSVTLNNVTAYVHDTGSAFIGQPEGRYDLAVGKDYTNTQMNTQPFANYGNPPSIPKIQLIPSGSIAGGGGGGGYSSGNNTVEEVLYAGGLLAKHPNNWMARDETGFRNILTKGGGDSTHCTYKTSSGGLFFPSVLNYLYTILEGGFIISGSGSLIENRVQNNGSGRLSNHATGGAVDIMKIGLASENKVQGKGGPNYERVCDQMYTYLSTFPKDGWADEHGWITRRDYGSSGFHTYRDDNPNHSHFGFDSGRSGSLLSVLKKK